MLKNQPRFLLAAPASGSGKTTVTCAILRALALRGRRVCSFKCGPDYIDPMFHRQSVGTAYSSNLDLFLGGEDTARRLLAENGGELAVIEGVMGYYDGLAAKSDAASSYALARATDTPVVLILNCRGASVSLAATVKGFRDFRPDSGIAAVLFNQLSPALYPDLKALVEQECGLPSAGYLPLAPGGSLESRHLGLVTAAEVADLSERLDRLAAEAERTVDFALLERIARDAPPLAYEPLAPPRLAGNPRIAVARDAAFCFYYEDSLSLLRAMGAEILEFSPLSDRRLPERTGGLLLGGGYPELYAARLAENAELRAAVKAAVESGMPTVAECGGFLYLHDSLRDADGTAHPMAGVIGAEGYGTGKLSHFGYAALTAKRDNLLCAAGETLPAHEFHYWDSSAPGDGFAAQKPLRETAWDCVHASPSLYAGFPHLYFPGSPGAAERFVNASLTYTAKRRLEGSYE